MLYGLEHSIDIPQVYEATIDRHRVGVVSRCIWGGPQAAILVEELAELGVKYMIGYGAAGGIVPDLPQGTQIVVSNIDGISR
jgi:uridine phosphorylase